MQIFIGRNNQQLGPYDLETVKTSLQNGSLSPNDLAWYEGAAGWAPLSTVPGIGAMPPPVPPSVQPPPLGPQTAPAPKVAGSAPAPAQPPKKTGLIIAVSVVAGILVLGMGILIIVRTTTRLFANQTSTRTVTATAPTPTPKSVTQNAVTPSVTQNAVTPSVAQNAVRPSVAPQSGGQLKTVSFPIQNPQITFQISKDATQLVKNEHLCFKYGFVVCVAGNLKETSTVGDNELKEAEEELTKKLTEAMTGVLQKEHDATSIHVNRTGHFKTAKGALIFYTEATYKNPERTEMICLNHVLASKKGMFIFQGYARQTEKDAFYEEMRRLLDSVSL